MVEKIVVFRNQALTWVLGDTFVEQEIKDQRIKICNECPNLKKDRSCSLCGCYIDVKAEMKTNLNPKTLKYEITHCDAGKWNDEFIQQYFLSIN